MTDRVPDGAKPRYWFAAKTYGYGWGLPTSWEGWVVLISFLVLVGAASIVILPRYGPALFSVCTVVLSLALVTICAIKGEPLKWRWGPDDRGPL